MRNITVTWEDIEWVYENDDEPYDVHTGGFIIDGSRHVQYLSMNKEQLVELHNRAKQDLDSMVECEYCSSFLSEHDGEWRDEKGSRVGLNQYDVVNVHVHKPDRLWFHILVDILEEYGAYEDHVESWYSDYSVVDYGRGIERQYAVHLDWDANVWEFALIDNEIERRRQFRAEMVRKLS